MPLPGLWCQQEEKGTRSSESNDAAWREGVDCSEWAHSSFAGCLHASSQRASDSFAWLDRTHCLVAVTQA